MTKTRFLINTLAKAGIRIGRIDTRRKRLFRHYEISHVLDVGANVGQYAQALRKNVGFIGEIVSFEPLRSAFETLDIAAKDDSKWQTVNCALGNQEGFFDINISENSVSSSFLSILPACEKAAPQSQFISHESVFVNTLDNVFGKYCSKSDEVYLKIDTQGFEKQVLDGGRDVLSAIDTVELEMSLSPLYKGEVLLIEMCEFMRQLGYSLVYVEPGFSEPISGRVLQVDGIFHRY